MITPNFHWKDADAIKGIHLVRWGKVKVPRSFGRHGSGRKRYAFEDGCEKKIWRIFISSTPHCSSRSKVRDLFGNQFGIRWCTSKLPEDWFLGSLNGWCLIGKAKVLRFNVAKAFNWCSQHESFCNYSTLIIHLGRRRLLFFVSRTKWFKSLIKTFKK